VSDDYPADWALGLVSREQRDLINDAGGRCQLGYAGCTHAAGTTSATIAGDPVADHSAACLRCANMRERARR
jgi:hypothetical protein